MIIDNFRLTFACNSSSTHSFIIPKDASNVKTDEFREFGWGYFTVAPKDIDHYLAASCLSNYGKDYIDDINKICKTALKKGDCDNYNVYVDHQSLLGLPYDFNGQPNWIYVVQLQEYLKNRNIGIIGGNDNDEIIHPLSKYETYFPGPVDRTSRETVAKFSGNQWVFFDKIYGTRIRFRLDNTLQPTRPRSPELVDLKITDNCKTNCSYCYQGSTPEGKDGDTKFLEKTILDLAINKVFEVAIGGGEATNHPDFKQIVELANHLGLTTNLTTRNYKFIRDNFKWCADNLGGIAISCDDIYSIKKAAALNDLNDERRLKFTVQIVCGGCHRIEDLIKECAKHNFMVTLLGFKTQERGENFRQLSYEGWKSAVKEHCQYSGFNVDTAFLHKHKEELEVICGGKEPASKFFTLNEGIYSCYVDGVNQKIAMSSYCDDSQYRDYTSAGKFSDLWQNLELV